MRVLVTLGATREPIDRVRFISNISTGRTGAALCERLAALGHQVHALVGEGAVLPSSGRIAHFGSTAELEHALSEVLGPQPNAGERIDAVVHCAAVADFTVRAVHVNGVAHAPETLGKLASDAAPTLELQPTPKLLPKLKSYAAPAAPPKVVGFKFTVGADADARAKAVAKLFAGSAVDYVVHNELAEFQGDRHPFRVFDATRELVRVESAASLADALSELLAS